LGVSGATKCRLDRANARRDIQAGIAFDAERLKRERAVETRRSARRAYSGRRL